METKMVLFYSELSFIQKGVKVIQYCQSTAINIAGRMVTSERELPSGTRMIQSVEHYEYENCIVVVVFYDDSELSTILVSRRAIKEKIRSAKIRKILSRASFNRII